MRESGRQWNKTVQFEIISEKSFGTVLVSQKVVYPFSFAMRPSDIQRRDFFFCGSVKYGVKKHYIGVEFFFLIRPLY